jgi:hypothetical protein
VFKFLLAQKELQLSDLTKVNLTVADVKISYVHGIWYEVSSMGQASSCRQFQINQTTAEKQQMLCWSTLGFISVQLHCRPCISVGTCVSTPAFQLPASTASRHHCNA